MQEGLDRRHYDRAVVVRHAVLKRVEEVKDLGFGGGRVERDELQNLALRPVTELLFKQQGRGENSVALPVETTGRRERGSQSKTSASEVRNRTPAKSTRRESTSFSFDQRNGQAKHVNIAAHTPVGSRHEQRATHTEAARPTPRSTNTP